MLRLAVICISLVAVSAVGQDHSRQGKAAGTKSSPTTAVTFDLMGFTPGMSSAEVEDVLVATRWIGEHSATNPSSLKDWCFQGESAPKGWAKVGLTHCSVYRELPADSHERLSFIFVDDKVAYIIWRFPHSQFRDVATALTKKYTNRAQPLYTQSTVQNRMGAAYSNHTLTWKRALSSAQLEEYNGDLDTSAVRLEDRSLVKEFDKRVPSRLPAL